MVIKRQLKQWNIYIELSEEQLALNTNGNQKEQEHFGGKLQIMDMENNLHLIGTP